MCNITKDVIARYEQFLLFPQYFQKTCTSDKSKRGLVSDRVKVIVKARKVQIHIKKDQSDSFVNYLPTFYEMQINTYIVMLPAFISRTQVNILP